MRGLFWSLDEPGLPEMEIEEPLYGECGSKQFSARPISCVAMFGVPPLGGLANNPMRSCVA